MSPMREEIVLSREELEQIDSRGMAAWDSHDAEAFADTFAESFTLTDWSSPEPITTREAAIGYAQAWFTAFPDMSVKLNYRVVGEESVATVLTFKGTNTGVMFMAGKEIPPTGKSVEGQGCYTARIENGKVVEFHSMPDIAGMMMQLGFMPDM